MNYTWKTILIIIASICSYSASLSAAELYIISNSGVSIEPTAIKGIFLGDTQFSGSVKLDVTDNNAAQSIFLAKALGIDKAKYDALWVKKSFRDGINQPPTRGSDGEVLEFVKKTPGAVGYVITAPEGVKIIQQY
jgi:hypothetical protein